MKKSTVFTPDWIVRLQARWESKSITQVLAILLVFSLTGSTVVFLRKAIFGWVGFDETTPFWLKTVTYILFIIPSYQIFLLVYGTLLGQFRFFWKKEKKLVFRLVHTFRSK